jgi:hypothetical protein
LVVVIGWWGEVLQFLSVSYACKTARRQQPLLQNFASPLPTKTEVADAAARAESHILAALVDVVSRGVRHAIAPPAAVWRHAGYLHGAASPYAHHVSVCVFVFLVVLVLVRFCLLSFSDCLSVAAPNAPAHALNLRHKNTRKQSTNTPKNYKTIFKKHTKKQKQRSTSTCT